MPKKIGLSFNKRIFCEKHKISNITYFNYFSKKKSNFT